MTNNDSSLFLHSLSDEELENIVNLEDEEMHLYYLQLIRRFYPGSDKETKIKLMQAYKGSFELEYLLRVTPNLADAFTAVYTKTGMFRELTNDLYFLSEQYQYQIN